MNVSLVGKTYPPVRFTVDPEHVRRFTEAIGDDGTSVPPTFVTAAEFRAGMSQVVGDADLGLDFTRVVHAEQEYEWSRPLDAGETLDVRTTIESIRSRGGHELLVLRTQMRGGDGALAVVARATLLVRP